MKIQLVVICMTAGSLIATGANAQRPPAPPPSAAPAVKMPGTVKPGTVKPAEPGFVSKKTNKGFNEADRKSVVRERV